MTVVTTGELRARVTRGGFTAITGLAAGGGLVGGPEGAVGVLAGGAVAIFSFRRLATLVEAMGAEGGAATRRRALGGGAFRHLVAFAMLSLAVATGWAHPLAVTAGVAILPALLLIEGLRDTGMKATE